jgi:very-short-patch-repair endonuclease
MTSTKSPSPSQLARLQAHARAMQQAPTRSEQVLWQALCSRKLGVQFRRQVVFGNFILDFVAHSARLVVEVDGGYHVERSAADERRDSKLRRAGLSVLHLPAELVLTDLPAAVNQVRAALASSRR